MFFSKFTSSMILVCGTPKVQGPREVTPLTSSKSCTCLTHVILINWKHSVGISRKQLDKHMDLELERTRNFNMQMVIGQNHLSRQPAI